MGGWCHAPGVRTSDAPTPRVLVSGLASGTGKTTVTAGLLGALRRRGHRVAAYKCGPDFLDAQVLGSVAGAPARNLDLWLVDRRTMVEDFRRSAPSGPRALSMVEGVMGLLDTRSWGTSTDDIARALGLPVVLVLDASASAETLALQARGARSVLGRRLGGVIVDRAGPGWHARTVRRSLETQAKVPVLGVLPWEEGVRISERHLGLRTPSTDRGREVRAALHRAASLVEEQVDLEALTDLAERAPGWLASGSPRADALHPRPTRRRTVAVARDEAFNFLYPENLEALERVGARLRMFSPVKGEGLPPGTEAVYLPGGYPELHADRLARNSGLRSELRSWIRDGRPLLAECGGMMYLLDRLVDAEGISHRMAGAFPGSTRMGHRLGGFGYVEARSTMRSPLGPARTRVRGHLYHHSVRTMRREPAWALEVRSRSGGPLRQDGLLSGDAIASYLHLRLDAVPPLVERLVHGPER